MIVIRVHGPGLEYCVLFEKPWIKNNPLLKEMKIKKCQIFWFLIMKGIRLISHLFNVRIFKNLKSKVE